ncbi:MAG: DUF1573 domain-containing protein [Anaerolinea sp.]|nr:DUF1573 domain-containing protein [Anaerolinea sp.]
MKKWMMLFGVTAVLTVLLTACGGQPEIVINEISLQLGDVVNGAVIQRELIVQNQGQADLNIEAVTTSCDCTQASVEPMTIPPGGSGTLHIEFDSGAHGSELTGQIIRQVFIASNDPQQPEIVVELAANILLPPAP